MTKLNFKNILRRGVTLGALAFGSGLVFLETMAYAQVSTATLSGTVEDNSGAVIPGANVTLQDQATVYTRKQSTNAKGFFTFVAVPSATYRVTIVARGFKTFVESDVHLDPSDRRELNNIRLGAGVVEETVNVNAATNGVSLDTGALSTTISSDQIQKLSVEGRDITELFKILPGFAINGEGVQGATNSAYDPSVVSPAGSTSLGGYVGNGTGPGALDLKLDGGEISSQGYQGINVNYDMVAETTVLTSNFGADLSNGPIVIDSVTKSGTTAFHGSIYAYARTHQLNATDWLVNHLEQPKAGDRDIYPGANLGGPVIIPGTNFNRSKRLTFFVGAEDYAQRNVFAYGTPASALVHALVPTAGMRTGDFSAAQLQQYLGPNYGSATYNNITQVPTQGIHGETITNGQLPPGDIDPGGRALLNTLPLPNVASNAAGFNYIHQNLVNADRWQGVARIDWAKSEKNHIFGRYMSERGGTSAPQTQTYAPVSVMGSVNAPGGGLNVIQNAQTGLMNLTTLFTPTLTNELFGGFLYGSSTYTAKKPSLLTAAGIGYPYQGAYANGTKSYPQFEDYAYDGLPLSLQPDASLGPLGSHGWNSSGGDNLTKVWGTHTVKVGAYMLRSSSSGNYTGYSPYNTPGDIAQYYNAFPSFRDLNGNTVYTSRNYLTNFLEGIVFWFQQSNVLPQYAIYYWNVDGYAEDNWKVRSNLNLTYGIRLEHVGVYNTLNNTGLPVFDPSQINNTSLPIPGFVWHGVDASVPTSGVTSKPFFAEPRAGFAWDIFGNGKTVLRGGFGMYRYQQGGTTTAPNEAATSSGLRGVLQTGYGSGVTLAAISTLGIPVNGGAFNGTIYGMTKGDNEQSQTKSYSFSIDHTFPHGMLAQVSYVGNNSDYLLNGYGITNYGLDNINALPIGALYHPNPVTGAPAPTVSGPTSADRLTTAEINDYRKYPMYGNLSVPSHTSYSNYNGIQAVLQHQSGPLLIGLNYTFSKAMGIVGSMVEVYQNGGGSISAVDQAKNYTPLAYDRSQIFNATYAYTFGHYVQNRLAGLVVNGWMLSGITNLQSGANIQTSIALDPNFQLAGKLGPNSDPTNQINVDNITFLGTPDVELQPTLKCNPKSGLGKYQYVNGACFGLPNIGQNGQYVFPYMHGPYFFNSDLTAQKAFKFSESKSLQFRIAAFNFLNHSLRSFTSSFPNQYALNLSNFTSLSPGSATYQPSSGFGFAPYKLGYRKVELSVKFMF